MSKKLKDVMQTLGEVPKAVIGDATGEVDIDKNGVRLKGGATVWRDMVSDLFSKRINGTTGTVDYEWEEQAIKFQSGGSIDNVVDRIGGNLEINHEFKVGTGITFKPHIHYWQVISGGAVVPMILTMEWRLQRNGQAKTTAWNTLTLTVGTNDVWDFTSQPDGTYNQITRFPDITVDCDISDTIQFRMARTDTETGDLLVYFFDLHGEIDSQGSEDEIHKN